MKFKIMLKEFKNYKIIEKQKIKFEFALARIF